MAQVSTVQITAYDAATTYILTIGNKTVSVIAQGSANATATGMATAWNALSAIHYPEFAEVTASAATDTVTLTADVAGRPFTTTSSVSGGTGTIGSVTTTTANAGPNDWSTAANWSGNAAPVDNDTVYIEDNAIPILYGLSQTSIDLTALHIAASYTGQIGLPKWNQGGYAEYRTEYLTLGTVTTLKIGYGPGQGSGRIKINTGSNACTCVVEKTALTVEPGVPSLCWKGVHASNDFTVHSGYVGISFFGLDAATLPTLRLGRTGTANVICGAGATLTTITQLAGTLEVRSNVTTLNVYGGVCTLQAAMTVTTLTVGVLDPKNATQSTIFYNSSGTCTTANIRKGGTLDFTQDPRSKTVTTANLFAGGTINDYGKVAAITTLNYGGGSTPGESNYNNG